MANRNQNYESGSRRQGNYRSGDDDENRYPRDYDRDYGQYAHTDEGERPARGGSFDQGRVQYGRQERDTREQSGSTGRYAGYGDFGQGDYGGEPGRVRNTGQDRYGQSGYGQSGYGQGGYGTGYGQGNYAQPNYSQGRTGYGEPRRGEDWGSSGTSNYGRSNYGSGRQDFDQDNNPAGYGATGGPGFRGQDYGYGATGIHRGKGPKNYQRSDERLKEMICERLHDDPHIDASEVTVQVQGGKITLDGTVESRHVKNAIEDVAEQFGVHDVQNNLRVQKQKQGQGSQTGSMTSGAAKSTYGSEEGEQSKQKRN